MDESSITLLKKLEWKHNATSICILKRRGWDERVIKQEKSEH